MYADPSSTFAKYLAKFSSPAVLLIFRFITGICSSAFLSVAGGSVSDMFAGHQVAMYAINSVPIAYVDISGRPTALYTLAPFLGPMLGPLISG